MRREQQHHLPTLVGLALTLTTIAPASSRAQDTATTTRSGGVVVHDGNGSVGLFLGGPGASGYIGSVGPNGTQGIAIGPDGRVRKIKPGTIPAGPPVTVRGVGPGGFDPFAFAFGDGPGPVVWHGQADRPGGFDLGTARRDFRRGDIRIALRSADAAARNWPDDSDAQQTRALALFALGRYNEAGRAARLALSGGATWDWATVRGFYARPDDYLEQLRALKQAAKGRSDQAEIQWLMAYHALILGRVEAGRDALRSVLRAQPDDFLARDLLDQLPPEPDGQGALP